VLNIHPALLLAFPGLHAERQALAHGVQLTGATHFVDEEADHGPILLQVAVPVLPGDTEETLHTRIQQQEHRAYPRAIQWIAERVRLEDACPGRRRRPRPRRPARQPGTRPQTVTLAVVRRARAPPGASVLVPGSVPAQRTSR
jgi:methionyl-tRNA formyltransferase